LPGGTRNPILVRHPFMFALQPCSPYRPLK
jgi:hypothetical protein